MARDGQWLVVRLAAVLALAACRAAFPGESPSECRWLEDRPRWSDDAPLADLSAVRPYRNYLAVTGVEPVGEHFTVWYPLGMVRLRVVRRGGGELAFELETGMWGGVDPGPSSAPAIPARAAPLAKALETALREHCSSTPYWKIAYAGRSRTVAVDELIAVDATRRGTRLGGWFARYKVAMDESLHRVLGTVDYTHGAGVIEVRRTAQWLARPPGNGTRLALVSQGPERLAAQIADAAQRYVAGVPGPALAALVPADAPLLPAGYVARVVARVRLIARHPTVTDPSVQLAAPIALHDAVFGRGAGGDAEAVLADRRYRLRATLTPAAPRAAMPGLRRGEFRGTLTLHITDDQGGAWGRAYPAHGALDLEGDAVVAPYGVEIPGASSPSPEWDRRHGALPGFGPYRSIDIEVDVDTEDDPRGLQRRG